MEHRRLAAVPQDLLSAACAARCCARAVLYLCAKCVSPQCVSNDGSGPVENLADMRLVLSCSTRNTPGRAAAESATMAGMGRAELDSGISRNQFAALCGTCAPDCRGKLGHSW